jgi:hypothetical protein
MISLTAPSGLNVIVDVDPDVSDGRAVTKRFSTTAGKH